MQSIKIGATEDEPYAFSCFTKYPNGCRKVGTNLEFIYTVLVEVLNLTVTWVKYNDYGALDRAIRNNSIELKGITGFLTKSQLFRTPPAFYYGIGFLVKDQYTSEPLNPLSVFSWDLWASLFTVTTIVVILDKVIIKNLKWSRKLTKIFQLFWFIVWALVFELYGNVLTNNLVETRSAPPFSDLPDLIEKVGRNHCTLAQYYKRNLNFFIFRNSTLYRNYKAALKTNPPIEVREISQLISIINNSTSCIVGMDLVTPDLTVYNSGCNIKVISFPNDILFHTMVYYHRLERLNKIFQEVFYTDAVSQLGNVLSKRYINDIMPKTCSEGKQQEKSITLDNLRYWFIILIIALFVNFITFLSKLLLKRFLTFGYIFPSKRRKMYYVNTTNL